MKPKNYLILLQTFLAWALGAELVEGPPFNYIAAVMFAGWAVAGWRFYRHVRRMHAAIGQLGEAQAQYAAAAMRDDEAAMDMHAARCMEVAEAINQDIR